MYSLRPLLTFNVGHTVLAEAEAVGMVLQAWHMHGRCSALSSPDSISSGSFTVKDRAEGRAKRTHLRLGSQGCLIRPGQVEIRGGDSQAAARLGGSQEQRCQRFILRMTAPNVDIVITF